MIVKKTSRLVEDPVVEEVRAIRAELWREAGGTVAGLIRLLEQRKPPKRRPTAAKGRRTARRA